MNIVELIELDLRCPKCRGRMTPRAVVGSNDVYPTCDSCLITVNPENGETMPAYALSAFNIQKCLELEEKMKHEPSAT